MSNKKNSKDGYTVDKEWWVMLCSTSNDHSVIKLQEDSNE